MTRAPFLRLFLLAASALLAAATVNAADCLAELRNKAVIPFDTTGLSCETVWDAQSFVLSYKRNGSTWSFVLTAPAGGSYIAIGFSPDGGMVGSSSVAGWLSDGKGMAKQYSLDGRTATMVVPDEGKLTLQGTPVLVSQSSKLYLAFQITTEQPPSTNLIYAIGENGFVPAADGRLAYHTAHNSKSIVYKTAAPSGGSPSPAGAPASSGSGSGTPSAPGPSGSGARVPPPASGSGRLGSGALMTAVAVFFAARFF